MTSATVPSRFAAPYAEDDVAIARRLLARSSLPPDAERRVDARARALIAAIRAQAPGFGSGLGGSVDTGQPGTGLPFGCHA